jgi:hypothetical protein
MGARGDHVPARRSLGLAVVCWGVLVWPAGAAPAAAAEVVSLIARTYNLAEVPPADLATARKTASAILAGAGIEAGWRHCSPEPGGAIEAWCDDALRFDEVIVRIAVATRATEPGSLGYSFVDTGRKRGWLAAVFVDRVASLAAAARVDRAELLGRVIAHEIAHLLLGTTRHTRSGLMRARWTLDEARDRKTSWLLSRQEAAEMRRDLAARSSDVPRELVLSAILEPARPEAPFGAGPETGHSTPMTP